MNSTNALRTKITRESLGSFDIKDSEHSQNIRKSINFNEKDPSSRHSMNEIGSKHLNNMNMSHVQNSFNPSINHSSHHYLHNHNHIHIHNHSHVHKLNFKSNDSDNLNVTSEIKEEGLVDEKLKVLMNIINSTENKDETRDKKTENKTIQKNYDDNEKNKKTCIDKKCFSLLTLINITTQISSLLLINNEFDVCRSYMNCYNNNFNKDKL